MIRRALVFPAKEYVALALLLAAAACASAPARKPDPAPVLSPEQSAMALAMQAFELGREAALSGDFACATDYFGRAIEAVRPPTAAEPMSPQTRAFSEDLFEAILRYEALAAPPEDAAGSEDSIAPELRKIEAPVASEEAISRAASAVASDTAGATTDIPIVVNEAVLRIIAVFQNDLHEVIERGLARSGRYMAMIQRTFEEEGIPRDLAQVAMIESSFLPRARSPRAAHGIWQFMPRTGRQYGLASNAVVDERSDPEKATRAAARHLKYLHLLFHDWYLAMAAYNAGEGKILKAMVKTGFSDYWQLAASGALKPQTVGYVPAVIAATLIAKNPAHYGFEAEYEKPLEYETVPLKRPVQLKRLARDESVSLEELQKLNPELRTDVTPRYPEGYELKVPVGTRDAVLAAYAAAPTALPPSYRRHKARRGETLASIARRFHVSTARLAEVNSLPPRRKLASGAIVLIPGRERTPVAASKNIQGGKKRRSVQTASSAGRRAGAVSTVKTYSVRGGDTLYRIALRHGLTVAQILAVNTLQPADTIKPGDKLTIPTKTR